MKENSEEKSRKTLTESPEHESLLACIEGSKYHRWVSVLEPWGILLAVLALVFSFYTLALDRIDRKQDLQLSMHDREREQIVNAWQLLAFRASGNSGKVQALEYLNTKGISLNGIDLRVLDRPIGTWLKNANLNGADLARANLTLADLTNAKLVGADLRQVVLESAILISADLSVARLNPSNLSRATLKGASLAGANLSGANLTETNLVNTNLEKANLRDANLSGANLSGANLDGAILKSVDFTGACADEETIYPDGMKPLAECSVE